MTRPKTDGPWRDADGKPLKAIVDAPLIGFGEPGLFYVNSGQSLGPGRALDRETIAETFPVDGMRGEMRGCVRAAVAERELRASMKTRVYGPGDLVLGRGPIRKVLEAMLVERRLGGAHPKRYANRLLLELRREKLLRKWRGVVDYIRAEELRRFIEERPARVLALQQKRGETQAERNRGRKRKSGGGASPRWR